MREGEKPTIEFLDGYLYALANFCYGCNYVPVYGAEELLLNDSNIEKALINNLGSKNNYSKFKRVEITAKQQLEILINKWVAKKIFDGKGSKNDFSSLRFSLAQHKSYFLEFIEEIVSEKYGLYSFSIEHEDFGCETEALCFYGNTKCLYIYFGWWD